MAFDEELAARVREHLVTRPGFSEKKMFGGLCFMLNGMVYVDADAAKTGRALAKWLDIAVSFAETLPAKSANKKAKPRPRRKAKA